VDRKAVHASLFRGSRARPAPKQAEAERGVPGAEPPWERADGWGCESLRLHLTENGLTPQSPRVTSESVEPRGVGATPGF
jgi:hypothetical protein